MIYLDSSVVLAHLLAENRQPEQSIWDGYLISSRLLQFEVWNRIHTKRLTKTHADEAVAFLRRIELLELTPAVLERALDPFPIPVRTLDSLHLASVEYIRAQGNSIKLASFDRRMISAARALGVEVCDL